MRHLIIFNGAAQSGAANERFEAIKKAFEGLEHEMHSTSAPKDATVYVNEYLNKFAKEQVRVYACGGDGTVSEVVNGMVGHDNAELVIVPIGTGNDFANYYGGVEKFQIEQLIKGEAKPVDLTKIWCEGMEKPMYSINVINFGFDAIVGAVGNVYKEQGKKDPYGKALKVAILKGRFNKITVTADGEVLNPKGKMLLCTLAQGQYVGGKFRCAPKSVNDDGLIDLCLLKTMPLLGFLGILNPYTEGQHLDNPKFAKKLHYRRVKKVQIDAPKDIDICVDGEMIKGNHYQVEVCPAALKLVIPQ